MGGGGLGVGGSLGVGSSLQALGGGGFGRLVITFLEAGENWSHKPVPEELTDSIGNNVMMLARKVEGSDLVEDAIGHSESWLPWIHNHPSKYQNQGAQMEVVKPIGVHKCHVMDQHDVDELDQL